ncbi:LysR family transcriptional regulator [Alkaliphilus sp. B6464]|uniref:LysR family transcriptional regulator n=1 Tax=Alkaliphilus sp. B6464 TaxID=2731219 RepID=UPI001BA53F68|nr:LysR family transcriptional regulator [Alkaliphilus sp. B6464]QUH18494.1 LysR family transcriptional regulator [Alkaliphilus sp. B6464]
MDIKDLAIFKTVASFGNITKAAEHLNYAQSNVTARINQLEHELEVDLFVRNSRGVVLTNSFVDGPIKNNELVHEICIDDELVLITGQQLPDPRKLELICKNDLIVVSQKCIYKRKFEQWVQFENIQLPRSIQVGTWDGIFASVELGLGFSITIRSLAEKYSKSNSFFIYELPKAYNQNPLVFLRRKDRIMTKIMIMWCVILHQAARLIFAVMLR